MGIGIKTFVVKSDDTFEHWGLARFQRLFDGELTVPEFAGQRLRYATVVYETEDRKATKLRRVDCHVMFIETDGRHHVQERMRDAMGAFSASTSPLPGVADARGEFYRRSSGWKPSATLRAALIDAAMGVKR